MKDFLAKYSITTHTIAAVLLFLVGADKLVPSFHDFWTAIYGYFPALVQTGLSAAVGLALLYFAGRKTPPDSPQQ